MSSRCRSFNGWCYQNIVIWGKLNKAVVEPDAEVSKAEGLAAHALVAFKIEETRDYIERI
jgi:hypothetical protein